MYLHQKILRIILVVGAFWYIFLFFTAVEANTDVAEWKRHAALMEVQHSLPPGLLLAICDQESNWRNGVTGKAGEIGLCQVQVNTVYMVCPSCRKTGARVFALNSSGYAVKIIQRALTAEGHYSGNIDGVFGLQTRAATFSYQYAKELRVDGVVGPVTWAALVREPYPGASIAAVLQTPHGNIEWAARYLVWLQTHVSSDPAVMMAAYNGGPANPIVKYMVSVNKRWERM